MWLEFGDMQRGGFPDSLPICRRQVACANGMQVRMERRIDVSAGEQ